MVALTYYTTKKYYAKNPPLAQLFMVLWEEGIRFYERPSVDSVSVGRLYGRMLFHGSLAAAGRWPARWVRRLPSEGGGFCSVKGVRELV